MCAAAVVNETISFGVVHRGSIPDPGVEWFGGETPSGEVRLLSWVDSDFDKREDLSSAEIFHFGKKRFALEW